jgi:hypothetical protein
MNQPRHFELVFLLAVFFSFSFISQSVADNSPRPPVFSEHEKALHQERMKYMTAEEKARYRDEQYQLLKQRAAAIGYSMPDTPPWNDSSTAGAPAKADSKEESLHELHQKQLEAYRQAAADKRKAMQDKIEKQREEIQQRIDRLVQQNAIKAAPPAPPQPPQPPVFSGYQAAPPMYPAYPGYYMMPPPVMPGYRY